MNIKDKEKFRLTTEEAEYIKDLIIENEYIIRASVRSVLQDKFAQLGEDCISEVYLLACKKIDVLKQHKDPSSWIIVASRKVALNEARRHNVRLKHTLPDPPSDIPAEGDMFEEVVYNLWMENHVFEKLLDLLTPHEQEVYFLLYKERLSSKEAANVMNVSDTTIRNINSVIKKKIKNGIKKKLF